MTEQSLLLRYARETIECPKLAVSRSPASSSERQLPRKLPLKLDESAAIGDPFETLNHYPIGLEARD
jgi:hypothetical protein